MGETINWTAVAAGAIAAFLLGWLVYSPAVFGRRWAEGSHISPEPPERLPVLALAAQFAALLLLATVVGLTASMNALGLALLAIVTAAAFPVANGAFTQKSPFAIAVDAGYILAAGVVMIVAQALL